MRVKRFEARSLKEAIFRVKGSLGPDAVILSVKEKKRLGGLFGRTVEVVAACDEGVDHDLSRERSDVGHDRDELISEIREVKSMLSNLLGSLRDDREWLLPVVGFDRDRSSEIVRGIIGVLREALLSGVDPDEVTLGHLFSKLLSRLMEGDRSSGKNIFFFLGPSGVGKTSSSLKVAFRMKEKGMKVCVVGVDLKPFSRESLSYYSHRLGLIVRFARSPQELEEILDSVDGFDLFLVDTFGVSPFNRFQVDELLEYMRPFRERSWCYLVLGATLEPRVSYKFVEAVGWSNVDSLILTKMDESDSYAFMFDHMLISGKPISYLSFGHKVPDDLEVATPSRVAELLLRKGVSHGGEKARGAF